MEKKQKISILERKKQDYLFTGDFILYKENLEESTNKIIRVNKFSTGTKSKLKSVVFSKH